MDQVLIKEKKYSGNYVALEDYKKNKVIAYGDDPKKVHAEAVKKGFLDPVILFIPSKDMVHIYPLG